MARARGGGERDRVKRLSLELDHLPLPLLVAAQLEVLRPLQSNLDAPLTLQALHAQHDLLRRLGLLPEDGLGLSAEALLLPVVAPPALGALGLLRLLVLRHAELLVLVALLAGTERPPVLRDVHHLGILCVW